MPIQYPCGAEPEAKQVGEGCLRAIVVDPSELRVRGKFWSDATGRADRAKEAGAKVDLG